MSDAVTEDVVFRHSPGKVGKHWQNCMNNLQNTAVVCVHACRPKLAGRRVRKSSKAQDMLFVWRNVSHRMDVEVTSRMENLTHTRNPNPIIDFSLAPPAASSTLCSSLSPLLLPSSRRCPETAVIEPYLKALSDRLRQSVPNIWGSIKSFQAGPYFAFLSPSLFRVISSPLPERGLVVGEHCNSPVA